MDSAFTIFPPAGRYAAAGPGGGPAGHAVLPGAGASIMEIKPPFESSRHFWPKRKQTSARCWAFRRITRALPAGGALLQFAMIP